MAPHIGTISSVFIRTSLISNNPIIYTKICTKLSDFVLAFWNGMKFLKKKKRRTCERHVQRVRTVWNSLVVRDFAVDTGILRQTLGVIGSIFTYSRDEIESEWY